MTVTDPVTIGAMHMRLRVGLTSLVGALVVAAACGRPAAPPTQASKPATRFDVVITNGRVVDGTGAPWFRADVGIVGDRITALGDLSAAEAATRIDAAGHVVAPGFIDLLGQSEFNVLVDNRVASKITQGITTEITGEGVSIAPVNDQMLADRKPGYDAFKVVQDFRTLAEYFARIEKTRSAVNFGTFVGSGGLRDYVIGKADRPATPDEIASMQALVAQAMADGALGVSSSLQYIPNRFASTDELVALAKTAAAAGGIYITHQRSEGNKVFESVDEVLTIAEQANIPAEVGTFLEPFKDNQTLFLIVVMILVIIVGTALDFTPTVLILTPVLMPLVKQAGIDPVYFGVLFIINNAIGLITPPVGIVLNVVCGVARVSMSDVVKGVMPFLVAETIVLFLLVLFPDLVLVPLAWLRGR